MILNRIFGKNVKSVEEISVKRIYVTGGKPFSKEEIDELRMQFPGMVDGIVYQEYLPPDYSTDPGHYHLPDYEKMSDEEYEKVRNFVRAFPNKVDAEAFVSYPNLDSLWCVVYKMDNDN